MSDKQDENGCLKEIDWLFIFQSEKYHLCTS
jgi:hypothetical protein